MKKPGRLILIGFMGSGKNHIARQLSRCLKLPVLDCDAMIERSERRTIKRIFREDGERYFRSIESKILRRALKSGPAVIATGGGAVLSAANRKAMRRRGYVVWLRATPSILNKRLARSQNRPLFLRAQSRTALLKILNERHKYYREIADLVVWNNRNYKDTRKRIMNAWRRYESKSAV